MTTYRSTMISTATTVTTAVALAITTAIPVRAQSGNVQLAGGGTLPVTQYRLDKDSATAAFTTVDGASVVLASDQIKRETVPSPEIVEYWTKAPLIRDTVEEHLEMAKYCQSKSLPAQADRHLLRVLELAPENEEAHKMLRHVKDKDGVWMSPKERLEQKGYTRYAGKTLTGQEITLEKRREENNTAIARQRKMLKALCKDFLAGKVRTEAFRQIKDPMTFEPIMEIYKDERNDDLRSALVIALGNMTTPVAVKALADISLRDAIPEIRLLALDPIKRRPEFKEFAVEYYRQYLLSPDNTLVNSAGTALGLLEVESAIPDLINALVTKHQRVVVLGSDQTGATFSNGRLQSFSPGTGSKQKVVTEQVANDKVYEALRRTISVYHESVPAFNYDVNRWKQWYRQTHSVETFSARRNP